MKEKEDEKEKEKIKTKFKLTIQGEDYYADTDYTKHQPMDSPVTTPNGTHTKYVYWDKDKNLTFDRSSTTWGSTTDKSSTSELQTTTGVSTTSSSSSSTPPPFKFTIQGKDYFAYTDYTKHQPMGSTVTTPNGTHTKHIYWDKDKNLTFDRSSTTWGSTTDEIGILQSSDSDSDTTLTGESATEDAA